MSEEPQDKPKEQPPPQPAPETAPPKPAAPEPPAPPVAQASPPANLILLVERWWQDWFPSSPVSRDTAAWNHAYQAKEDLKKRLAAL